MHSEGFSCFKDEVCAVVDYIFYYDSSPIEVLFGLADDCSGDERMLAVFALNRLKWM